MKKFVFIFIMFVVLIGCSTPMAKHRKHIREGIFISGLNQFAFLEEWGKPDEQATWTVEGGQYQITYGLRGVEVGGRHKAFNDVWIYYKQNRILFFANHRLVANYKWDDYQKGDREKKELPAIMK
ncbi:MAG: hypothetical protein A2V86_13860 [Deltaproteobacteria bacterium RBG_16_49_23]|nr:MAG: hypothetical protein A2V86_13860 [Deltaproteobacteria bacterium RBG_16_49_23]